MWVFSDVVIFLVLLGRTVVNSAVCPEKDVLKEVGCVCSTNPKNMFECNFNNVFRNAYYLVEILESHPIEEIHLNNMYSFPTELCEANIQNMIIRDSLMVTWNQLDGCNFVKLHLHNVTFLDEDFIEQGAVPNLATLIFSNMVLNVTHISNFTKLKRLDCLNCTFINEGDMPFRELTEMHFVSSKFGEKLSRHSFPLPANYLEVITLKESNLTDLPKDLLSEIPHLKKLDISKNHLRSLDAITFADFHGTLIMEDNPWDCSTLYWLRKREKEGSIKVQTPDKVECSQPKGLYLNQLKLKHKIGTEESWRMPPAESQEAPHTKPQKAFKLHDNMYMFVAAAIFAISILGILYVTYLKRTGFDDNRASSAMRDLAGKLF